MSGSAAEPGKNFDMRVVRRIRRIAAAGFTSRRLRPLVLWAGLVLLCRPGATAFGGDAVNYFKDVKPLLEHRCFSCHGALEENAGLRLDAGELIRKGGESGAVIVAGNAPASLLIQRVSAEGQERMPPEGEGDALSPEEIRVLAGWIEQGAVIEGDDPIPPDPRAHWAYQLPQRTSRALPLDPDGHEANLVDAYRRESSRGRRRPAKFCCAV
jgi:hypothetical protein